MTKTAATAVPHAVSVLPIVAVKGTRPMIQQATHKPNRNATVGSMSSIGKNQRIQTTAPSMKKPIDFSNVSIHAPGLGMNRNNSGKCATIRYGRAMPRPIVKNMGYA